MGTRLVGPGASSVTARAGTSPETSSKRNGAPEPNGSSRAASAIQVFDIGAGYVLETGSLGTRLIAPSALTQVPPQVRKSLSYQSRDNSNGYMLVKSIVGEMNYSYPQPLSLQNDGKTGYEQVNSIFGYEVVRTP